LESSQAELVIFCLHLSEKHEKQVLLVNTYGATIYFQSYETLPTVHRE